MKITETIEWHEEASDPAPASDSHGMYQYIIEMSLLSVDPPRCLTVTCAYKDAQTGGWFMIDDSPLPEDVWKISYWAWLPQGPGELALAQSPVDIPCVSGDH